MKQKIIKIGNAHGIIIPKTLLAEAGLKPGDTVVIEKEQEEKTLRVGDKPRTTLKSSVTPEFWKHYENVRNRYNEALKELAKR